MKRDTTYDGKQMWVRIDPVALSQTGEVVLISDPVVTDASTTRIDRAGFEITYIAYLLDIFDQLGGQRYKVLQYIIKNKNSDNMLVISQRELAAKCGVSTQTVYECLRLLKEKGLIATRTGAIMLLPKIAHRGSAAREQYLMHRFVEFDGNAD